VVRCQRVGSITAVQPLHVAAWIEQQTREHAAPTAKLRLAVPRNLFDWLVTGQVIPTNPAGSMRGPAHVVKAGKTPVLAPEEARTDRRHRNHHAGWLARPGADRAETP
jgi:integrase/recombinase XerC